VPDDFDLHQTISPYNPASLYQQQPTNDMKTFALIFRMDIITKEAQPTEEQLAGYMQDWMRWIDSIAAKDMLAEGGNHFLPTGNVLRPGNTISDGPYEAHKESVAGYILVHANDLAAAVTIAKACPILNGEGTSVEVRETASM
jgi:hypothetical protein